MKHLIYAVVIIIAISFSCSAVANDNFDAELGYIIGVAVGSSIAGHPESARYRRYYNDEYRNPLNKGGSLNPDETEYTTIDRDGYEKTINIRTYTDFYGNKHVVVDEW